MTLLNWNLNTPNPTAAWIVYAVQAATLFLTWTLAFLQQTNAIVMPMDPFGLQDPKAQ